MSFLDKANHWMGRTLYEQEDFDAKFAQEDLETKDEVGTDTDTDMGTDVDLDVADEDEVEVDLMDKLTEIASELEMDIKDLFIDEAKELLGDWDFEPKSEDMGDEGIEDIGGDEGIEDSKSSKMGESVFLQLSRKYL